MTRPLNHPDLAAAALFAGAGEMRSRCRELNWATTPFGPVAEWPVSLRTTVAMMLAASHPMILFWGPERAQIYNDAYIPTLGGRDRHPAALAMRAEECWSGEVWTIVRPQIDEVIATGTAIWHEDQFVPLPRHGRVEESYWTYGYNPAFDDDLQVAGVLVITHETTGQVVAGRERQALVDELSRERERLTAVFEQAPVAIAVLRGTVAAELVFELANRRYLELLPPGREVIGRELRAVVPELSAATLATQQQVLDTAVPFLADEYPVPLDRDGDGVPEDYYFNLVAHPLTGYDGRVLGTIMIGTEVTEFVRARQVVESANERLQAQSRELERVNERLQEQTATMASQAAELSITAARLRERTDTAESDRARAEAVLNGMADAHFALDTSYRVLTANAAMERYTQRSREALIGRSIWELLPAGGTEIEAQLRRVTDERVDAHFTHEMRVEGEPFIAEIDAYPDVRGGVAVFWRDVTERVRAAAALAESEARLRAVYDGTYEYIGLLAPDGTVLDANRASLAFAGNTREQVVGRPFWETPWFSHTPGAPERLRTAVARAAGGEFVRYTAPLTRPDGRTITFDFSLYPVRNARGDVVYIVPEGRDITDRVLAEQALRESETRYSTLIASVDQALAVIEMIVDEMGHTIDYRFLETNPAFVEQSGFVDAVGRTARELVPTLEPYWIETYGRVAATGEPTRFQNVVEPIGRWFDVYAFRTGRPSDRRVALLFTDITEAKTAEREREQLLRALELERSRLVDVFRQAPAFLALVRGPEHVFDLVNDAYYQLVGHRDLIGKPVFDALPEVRGQGFKELLDEVFTTGVPFIGRELPLRVARTPGAPPEERFVDFSYLPMREADGSTSGIIAHGTDVTEQVVARHRVEQLLGESERARAESESARAEAESARAEAEAARREAEAANRAKGEFLAVMSHELRTPLNAIGGYAELLEMGIRGPVTVLQREDLRRIQTSQLHLLGLINEVLNYARLDTGTVHYEVGEVAVREALIAAEALVAPQARVKGIDLTVAECPARLTLLADAEKLRQILVNLLSNAVKFTDRGGQIRISAAERGPGTVAVRVQDTGIGIPADKLAEIFDPFVQVRANLTRPHEGTGLGLAISRDLARGMNGDLAVESALGIGSTFILTLPRPSLGP